MFNIEDYELKLFRFIDYIYLSNFLKNSLENDFCQVKNHTSNNNEWKIFSTHYINETVNILYFIRKIITDINFSEELLLNTVHIYSKICKKYAHLIDNYISLFASVYIAINKIFCDNQNYLSDHFMSKILNIPLKTTNSMVEIVDNFIDNDDIYFDSKEKENLKLNIFN